MSIYFYVFVIGSIILFSFLALILSFVLMNYISKKEINIIPRKKFDLLFKIVIICLVISVSLIYFWMIPSYGLYQVHNKTDFYKFFVPWMTLILSTGIPVYLILYELWNFAKTLNNGIFFTEKNSVRLNKVAKLIIFDITCFLIFVWIFGYLGIGHPGIIIYALVIYFIGLSFAVSAMIASFLFKEASKLKTQIDLTI